MSQETTIREILINTPFFIGGSNNSCESLNPYIKNISIGALDWQIRFYNVLKNYQLWKSKNINNLYQLLNTDYNDFLILRNCGVTTIKKAQEEIIKFLLTHKIVLESNIEQPEILELKNNIPANNYTFSIEKKEFDDFLKIYPFSRRLGSLPTSLKKYLDVPLNKFEFPIRFNQVLTKFKDISTLSDLLSLDPDFFSDVKNLGRKTFNDVYNIIDEKIKNFETSNEHIDVKDIVVVINNVLDKLSERELTILNMRWGKENETSLEKIGSQLNLTRERIRQIIERVIKKINIRVESHADLYRKNFLEWLIKNPKPITDQIFKETKEVVKYKSKLYLGVLSELFQEAPFHGFIPISFESYISRQIERDRDWAKIHNILENLGIGHLEVNTQKLVEHFNFHKLKPIQQLRGLKMLLGLKKYFFYKEGNSHFLLKRGGIKDLTYKILNYCETPMNIEEILEIIRKYYYSGTMYESYSSVIGNIKLDERIIQYNRYEFGTEKHLAYQKKEWIYICNLAKNFLKKAKRQCYITEILEALYDSFPNIKSKYELVHILRTDNEINDLGFFNFSLISSGQGERVKVCDLIKDLYEKNTSVKHFHEIREELKKNRFIHDQGMSALLKSQKYLKNYTGGFYGLKRLDRENEIELIEREKFVENLINHFFPYTDINNVISYFGDEIMQQRLTTSIANSEKLQIYTLDTELQLILNKSWSTVKIIKCLLANIKEDVYEEQLEWMLKDLGINNYAAEIMRIKKDERIVYKDGKYKLIKLDADTKEINLLLGQCYDFIFDTTESITIKELFDLISSENERININQFEYYLKEDERFLITETKLVLIK